MERTEAFEILEKEVIPFIKKNTHFSNINKTNTKKVYWLEIPIKKIKDNQFENMFFLLYNNLDKTLYVLNIPISFLYKNLEKFSSRLKGENEHICLELTVDKLEDIRPLGSKIQFSQFISYKISKK